MDIVPASVALPQLREVHPLKEDAWSVAALSRPATEFTGDFYFATEIDDALWFAVGDFAGHGLEAAIFMAMIQEELDRVIRSCRSMDPAEVVAELDREIRAEMPYNRFVTLVAGRASRSGRVEVVNAGHCYPILIRASGEVELIGSHGPIVGLLPRAEWHQESIALERDDRFVLYTDGIVEASNASGCEFGRERLLKLFVDSCCPGLVDEVFAAVDDFSAGQQSDDRTLFVLTRT